MSSQLAREVAGIGGLNGGGCKVFWCIFFFTLYILSIVWENSCIYSIIYQNDFLRIPDAVKKQMYIHIADVESDSSADQSVGDL